MADIQALEEHLTEMRAMHGRGDFDAMEDKVRFHLTTSHFPFYFPFLPD
jgi:hypothetical protein